MQASVLLIRQSTYDASVVAMAERLPKTTDVGNSQRGMRFLISAAGIVILLWGINQAQSVLALILVSGFLAVIGTPPALWLMRRRIPSAVAVLIVIAGIIAVLTGIGVLAGLSLKRVAASLPAYQVRLEHRAAALEALLAPMGIRFDDKALLGYLSRHASLDLSAGALAKLGVVVSGTVLILLTVSFILLEASSFPIKLRAALGDPSARFPEFSKFVNDMKRYLLIQTAVSLTVGLLSGAWFAVLGVDFAILFGLLVFVLNYVPNVGAVLAIIPVAILTFLQFGLGRTALAVAGYVVVMFAIGSVVQPRLMGRTLGLSTLVVFLSLIVWGRLLGVSGMMLCVPLTMGLKFALERSDNTRWIAALLDREPSPKRSAVIGEAMSQTDSNIVLRR